MGIHTGSTWKLGDFATRPAVGAFETEPDEMDLLSTKHGLGLQKSWVYGFFTDTKGLTYCVERNFVGSLTSGAFVMTQDGDKSSELNVHPASGRSARGELRRIQKGKTRRWHEPVFQRLPAGCFPEGEQLQPSSTPASTCSSSATTPNSSSAATGATPSPAKASSPTATTSSAPVTKLQQRAFA